MRENKESKIRYLKLKELSSFQSDAWVKLYEFLFVNMICVCLPCTILKDTQVLEHSYLSFIKKIQHNVSSIEKRATEPLLSKPKIVERRTVQKYHSWELQKNIACFLSQFKM